MYVQTSNFVVTSAALIIPIRTEFVYARTNRHQLMMIFDRLYLTQSILFFFQEMSLPVSFH